MKKFKRREIREAVRLYAVTDRRWLKKDEKLTEVCKTLLANGITCLQYREKKLQGEAVYAEAAALCRLCHEYGVPFIVNDDWEMAVRTGADGVHLGQEDLLLFKNNVQSLREMIGPEMIIGISVQTEEEAVAAQRVGADYLGAGAVFPTGTKKDAKSVSLEELKRICSAVSIPVIAIGGITEKNINRLAGRGIEGTALISSLFAAADYGKAAQEFASLTRSLLTPPVLSVAGSDSSGGAGLQADLKTMSALGCYGMTAVTSLTAQNTLGVTAIRNVTPDFLQAQLEAVFSDIRPRAVKTGMLPNAALVKQLAVSLKHYRPEYLVVDPVMAATSGAVLAADEAVQAMKSALFPQASLLTPNIPEAEILAEMPIKNAADMERAAQKIAQEFGCAVLVKGGHGAEEANDVLCSQGKINWFFGKKIMTANTHGTGCTLSSAIACFLAKGLTLQAAVGAGKEYLAAALSVDFSVGHGNGPFYHLPRP